MTLSVLDYDDYRLFLKDLYSARKASRAGYSYRRFAEDLGFTPSNFIHLVVSGKRNLSQDAIDKIKSHLKKWTAQQKKFFQNLVFFNQSGQGVERDRYRAELDKILGKKRALLNPDQDAYFSNWYVPVIREILALKGFVSDLSWIVHKLKPRVERTKVQEALRVLARLKMIVKRETGWSQNDEHLATPAEITSDLVHNYHAEMLKLSAQAIDLPAESRDVSAMTMSLSPAQFAWLKQRVVDFRDEIQQELQGMDDKEHTLVAQLNIQLFPVTKDE